MIIQKMIKTQIKNTAIRTLIVALVAIFSTVCLFETNSLASTIIDYTSDGFFKSDSSKRQNVIFNTVSAGKSETTAVFKPSGLIGFWAGDGNANDSQETNNGILSSGAGYAVGKVGQSFIFNGTSNSVINNSTALNPSTAMTLEVWIKPTAGQNVHRDIIGKDGENSQRQYLLTVSDINRLRAHIGSATQGFPFIDGGTTVPLNVWTHAAMTYDGSTLRVYYNGVQDNSLPVSGAIVSTTQPLRIGGGAPTGIIPYYFTGLIDEASLYNRALSAAEIKSIYDAGFAGKLKSVFTPNISDSQIIVGDVAVTFPSVTTSGETRQVPLDISLFPSLPTDSVATGLSYDISTDAVFTGNPTLCFHLPSFNNLIQFSRLRILHLEDGIWINRTTTSNFTSRILCGQTSFLSPFAIADNLAPTAASISVSGRATTANGRGISNARISVTDASGNTRMFLSNSFGYYRFDDLPAGQTYIFQAQSKRYQFINPTQVLSINEEMNEVNFTASP